MKRATASKSDMEQGQTGRHEGLENLVGQELREIVGEAIQSLKTNYRAVLIMRCYDGMSYADIAASMGSTEFGTRMLFLRAKKALQKQLARQGLGRGTLMAALLLFGKMTAPSKAAAAQVVISHTTLQAGVAASVAAAATGKAALLSLAAVSALTVGTAVQRAHSLPDGSWDRGGVAPWTLSRGGDRLGLEKHWYYLPAGAQGPVFLRLQVDPGAAEPSWVVLQNARANYLYDGSRLTLESARWYDRDLHVMRLPCDGPALRSFLDRMEGAASHLPSVPLRRGAAVINLVRDGDGYRAPSVRYNDYVLEEDIFVSDLTSQGPALDERDALHRQGYAYFTVQGQIDGRAVRGGGCIPFVYQARRAHQPWLAVTVGSVTWADAATGSWRRDARTGRTERYPASSFFAGLSRPWAGLHVVDTIRRDAAAAGYAFRTRRGQDPTEALVSVEMEGVEAEFLVDLSKDLLRRIRFRRDGDDRLAGEWVFSYVARRPAGLRVPVAVAQGPSRRGPGLAWLANLVEE